ncbi:hypothetical protein [Streptomyces sp. NPDC005423]
MTGVSPSRIGVARPRTPLDDAVDAFVLSCRAVCGDGGLAPGPATDS